MKHLIAAGPTYKGHDPGDGSYPTAPLTCACDWQGVLSQWADHREEHGQKRSGGHTRAVGQALPFNGSHPAKRGRKKGTPDFNRPKRAAA